MASSSSSASRRARLTDCPDEVLERIFSHLGFKIPSPSTSPSSLKNASPLASQCLRRSQQSVGAMALALSCKRLMAIFSRSFETIRLTNRESFGRGLDAECRAIISVAGPNLRRLSIDDMKRVGPETLRGLITHCPNVACLDLQRLPCVQSEDLASFILKIKESLTSINLSHLHIHDDVLNAMGANCASVQEMHLEELDSPLSASAFRTAVSGIAGSVRTLRLRAIFGSDLSIDALLPPDVPPDSPPAFPNLERLDLISLGWVRAVDVVSLCLRLAGHCPRLRYLFVVPRSDGDAYVLTEEEIARIRQEAFPNFTHLHTRHIPDVGVCTFNPIVYALDPVCMHPFGPAIEAPLAASLAPA